MEPDKNTEPKPDEQPPKDGVEQQDQRAPADALSRTPEDLEKEAAEHPEDDEPEEEIKKLSPIKRFFRKVNVYFLIFVLIAVVVGATAIINFLNSQNEPTGPTVASQELTQDALKQLANTDASVGNSSQTLTIQGNAIIAGQTLMRGNLNIAGNLQTGGSIQGPTLTISGTSNLGEAQINSLQVATNTAIQGTTTLRDLNVAGASTFSGNVTANQVTVTRLILSGNAVLQVPNHISFTGPAPTGAPGNALGNGGSASVNGSDTSGTVNVNTGNSPTAGCFMRINYRQAYANQTRVIVSPVGNAAGQTQFYVDKNNTGFSICTANAAPGNQAFAFDYFVAN